MPTKRVLITFNRAPHGSIFHTEGLRAVVGVTSGIDEHTVDVVYLGDGVYCALRDADRDDAAKYLNTLQGMSCPLQVERESLLERGLSEADLAPGVQVI